MKVITLTNSELPAIVDDCDFDRLSQFGWLLVERSGLHYAMRYENLKAIPMHRVVLDAPEGRLVDHRDRDGLNNQRNNLRLCSHAENMRNRKKHVNGLTSEFKGVYFEPLQARRGKRARRSKPWCAQLTLNKKKIRRYFAEEFEAARTYDVLAKRFHGEFASLNFNHS